MKIRVADACEHKSGFNLFCDHCRRFRRVKNLLDLKPQAMPQQAFETMRLDEVEDRLSCAECGGKGASLMLASSWSC